MPGGTFVRTDETVPVIVVLKDQPERGMTLSTMQAEAAYSQASVLSSISAIDRVAAQSAEQFWIVNAIKIEVDPAAIEEIARLPGVDHVEPDLMVQVDDPVFEISDTVDAQYLRSDGGFEMPWNLDWIEAPAVWCAGNMGDGVRIAVVDSGIDGSHPAFEGKIVGFADFVNGENTSAYDDNGHGTHCAGTAAGGEVELPDGVHAIIGVAPEAELLGAKVLNAGGSGSNSDILKGIQWSVENEADVVSLSLGGYEWDTNVIESDCNVSVSINSSETVTLTLDDVCQNLSGVYEAQFVVGGYQVQGYGACRSYSETDPANLSMTLYAPGMKSSSGGYIDWDGFDHSSNQVVFKAPYSGNTENWDGKWTLQVTNNGNETVYLDKIGIAEAFQSNGNSANDLAVDNLAELGVVVVVAAGNNGYYGTGTIGSPGTARDVITVGATDYCMDFRASFSSIGPVKRDNPYIKPDMMAPGASIPSACSGGGYTVMSGTSMATPGVAGTVALMLAGNESLTPAEVKRTLMDTAVHIKEDGTAMATPELNNLYGAGRISAYKAVEVTDGLNGTIQSSALTELFGGAYYDAPTNPDTVQMLGVCWNTTAGAPMAGETVNFSVYTEHNSYPYSYDRTYYGNVSDVTDADGMATATIDVSNIPEGLYICTDTVWQDRILTDICYKYKLNTAEEEHEIELPLFKSQDFVAPTEGTFTMRYPLLDANGSAYTQPVRLVAANSSTTFFDESLTPVNGVVEATIDFAEYNVSSDSGWARVEIDGQFAGYVTFSYEVYYEGFVSPNLAICPPGDSMEIALQVAEPHSGSGTVTSKDYCVYVTTFTDTEILSLSPEIGGSLAAGMPVDAAALLEAAGGMKPEESVGTVNVRNGIGIYPFTMPEDCYVAVVSFADPEWGEYNYYDDDSPMTSVVYGAMSPWTLHRYTPTVPVALDSIDSTYIWVDWFEWPATWNQSEYRSVPGDQATITARVYTWNDTTCEESPGAGKTVRLYTSAGAQTNTTGADGTCTFTLDVAGKNYEEMILITDGIDAYGYAYPYACHNYGGISGVVQAPAALWPIWPDRENRWTEVDYQGNGEYLFSAHSYGPDYTGISEHGVFTAGPCFGGMMGETEFAETLAYAGTWSKVLKPSVEGLYQASVHLLEPGGSFQTEYCRHERGVTFSVPEAEVDYEVDRDVLAGSTVPVTFTVTDNDNNPVSNAKVGLFLGAATWIEWHDREEDVRAINIDHLNMEYPDPYSEVLTGYTDASGQVTLNIHAPSAEMALERKALGHSDYVFYKAACYKDDEIIKPFRQGWDDEYIDPFWRHYDGAFKLTTRSLPDFVPVVSAPHVVKLYRDDTVTVNDLYLKIENQGTADFEYDGINPVVVNASVGSSPPESTKFRENIAVGETKTALHTSVQASASDYGIDTSNYNLPVDVNVDVTVNPHRTIDEVTYANNNLVYPVRITAPDLAAEIGVPSVVVQSDTPVPITLKVTNEGEVPSAATTMIYSITGTPEETIDVPALGPGRSYNVSRDRVLLADTYTLNLGVNLDSATDYETTFENNHAGRTVNCYLHPTTSIVLPQDLVLVPGTTYELPIVVEGAENLSACLMTFTFNPEAFNVTDVTAGEIPLFSKNLKTPGQAIFEADTPTGVSGDVTVATLHLSVTGSSGTESALHLDAGLSDRDEYTIPVEVTQGNAVLLLYGDANNDGTVNQADTLRVLREVVGLTTGPTSGTTTFLQTDVHENRAIEVGDAMFIAQKNVGLRDHYFRIV